MDMAMAMVMAIQVMDMEAVAMVTVTMDTITQDMVGVITPAAGLEGDGVGGHLVIPLLTGQAPVLVQVQARDQEQLQVCVLA